MEHNDTGSVQCLLSHETMPSLRILKMYNNELYQVVNIVDRELAGHLYEIHAVGVEECTLLSCLIEDGALTNIKALTMEYYLLNPCNILFSQYLALLSNLTLFIPSTAPGAAGIIIIKSLLFMLSEYADQRIPNHPGRLRKLNLNLYGLSMRTTMLDNRLNSVCQNLNEACGTQHIKVQFSAIECSHPCNITTL